MAAVLQSDDTDSQNVTLWMHFRLMILELILKLRMYFKLWTYFVL